MTLYRMPTTQSVSTTVWWSVKVLLMLFLHFWGAVDLALFVHKCLHVEVQRMQMLLHFRNMYSLLFLLLSSSTFSVLVVIFNPVPTNTNISKQFSMIAIIDSNFPSRKWKRWMLKCTRILLMKRVLPWAARWGGPLENLSLMQMRVLNFW